MDPEVFAVSAAVVFCATALVELVRHLFPARLPPDRAANLLLEELDSDRPH